MKFTDDAATVLNEGDLPNTAAPSPHVNYHSEIQLGLVYTDTVTNFVGVATSICFDLPGHQMVMLETVADSKIVQEFIDASRLVKGSRHDRH